MKPLTEITAADVMTRELILIPAHMTLRAAAHLMAQGHVTGAPVINEDGVCVGVISATDVMRCAERMPGRRRREVVVADNVCADWQMVELESVPIEEVCDFMSRRLVSADAETGIAELARLMLDCHVHRVVIVDDDHRPIGIVSTMDLLRHVAETVEQYP
jgi:predicted transcriptional regulator